MFEVSEVSEVSEGFQEEGIDNGHGYELPFMEPARAIYA